MYPVNADRDLGSPGTPSTGRRPDDIVLHGVPAPLPKKGVEPPSLIFSQTAGWIKMPLGTDVDLGAGHILLDGVPALQERDTTAPPPLFGACLLWPRSPISATAELL